MKKIVLGIGIILLVLAMSIIGSALIVAVAQPPPPIPESYSGTAILDGSPAQVGTPVTVEIYDTGDVVGETTINDINGSYSLQISFDVADGGDPLTWKISGIECTVPSSGTDKVEFWNVNDNFTLVAYTDDTTPPVVTNPSANPASIPANGVTTSRLNVTVTDDVEVDKVTVDLRDMGRAITPMYLLGENIWSVETNASLGTHAETYYLKVNATDVNGNYNDTVRITLVVTATTGDININEIMYNPSTAQGSDADMEWLELYNNDMVPININSWTLDGNSITSGAIVQPGGYLIIARNETAFEAYYTEVNPAIVLDGTFILGNDEDTVVLKNVTEAEINNVTYIDDWGADGNGKTLELNETGWYESEVDRGTPGEVNSVADWSPWVYNTRPPYGVIDKSEAIDAVQDYFDDIITKEQALDVIQLYFG